MVELQQATDITPRRTTAAVDHHPQHPDKETFDRLRALDTAAPTNKEDHPIPIIVCMGVSGCGKTSVAKALAEYLGCRYLEGDSLHPKANIDKMSSGHPLTDEDRYPWLQDVRKHCIEEAVRLRAIDTAPHPSRVIVVTCSSLKRSYRAILSDVPSNLAQTWFVYLQGSPELLYGRMKARKGHFMEVNMLQSQLDTLEEPDPSTERVIVASIVPPPEQVAKDALRQLVARGVVAGVDVDKIETP